MSLRDRIAALEADNDRLRAEQARLFAVLDRLTVAVERLAGVEPPPAPAPATSLPPCRALPPRRHHRRVRGGEPR